MAKVEKSSYIDVVSAAKLSGLTTHMLTYLGRIELLKPSGGPGGRGRPRRYTFSDVLFLRLIADMLQKGIEVKRLTAALKRAKAEADTWLDITRAPRHFLVTDGTEVFLRRKGALESKTVDRQLVFAFVIDLAVSHSMIASQWPTRRARRQTARK